MFSFVLNLFNKKKELKKNAKFDLLQKQAERVIEQLEKIPKDFCPTEQKELFVMANENISPALRKLRPFLQQNFNLKDQEALAYQNFKKRIKQAKQQICQIKEADSEKMKKQAFFNLSVQRMLDCIDRDRKLLLEYSSQIKKESVCIASHLQKLSELKKTPKNLNIKDFPSWSAHLTQERAKLFNEAIDVLDNLRS
jgi:hypothetical protein